MDLVGCTGSALVEDSEGSVMAKMLRAKVEGVKCDCAESLESFSK